MLKRSPLKTKKNTLNKTSALKNTGKGLQIGNKGLKKGKRLSSKPVSKEEQKENKKALEIMWEMFLEIWQERGPYSEVSKEYLGSECRSVYMHHIYPKSKYKELKYTKDNIIILSWPEHDKVENDIYCWPEVNKRREVLKEKYEL